ncbi:hypothetical protein C5U62_22895 [Pseudomonas protegens]|uniref:Uncharacterized protein n=1 Tax=Pseudomonas protegens TaxID=380021 RepID=A0A2T6GH45_9PSED|nr:hypothetical protein C5U62_22895 [Pseudomonas protegens]
MTLSFGRHINDLAACVVIILIELVRMRNWTAIKIFLRFLSGYLSNHFRLSLRGNTQHFCKSVMLCRGEFASCCKIRDYLRKSFWLNLYGLGFVIRI